MNSNGNDLQGFALNNLWRALIVLYQNISTGGLPPRLRNALFVLFVGGILAYGAGFAWYMLARFDLVNLLRDVIERRRLLLLPANPRPEYAPRNAPLRPNDPKFPLRAYPCLIRTIVLCGITVAVASLPACSRVEPSERSMPRPAVAPTVGLLLNEPEAFGGYTLINTVGSKTTYLINDQGAVVHRWKLGVNALFARLLENGNLLVQGEEGGHVSEVDRHGNAVWKCTREHLHHDALKMPNGNVLLLSLQRKTAAEAIAAGADPDFIDTDGLAVPHIIEAKPTGRAAKSSGNGRRGII